MHDATKGERRAARKRISRYYESELAKLIDRVEEALTRYRDGEIDAHEVDDVIHAPVSTLPRPARRREVRSN